MSTEDTMVASEAEDVAKDDVAPAVSTTTTTRRVRVDVSPVATAVPPQSQGWRQQESEEGNAEAPTKKLRATWFKDMRGWLMVLAMQVASSTYQAGLNPPLGFAVDGAPMLESTSKHRYYIFFYANTTAFVTSLASIILLMNPSFYYSEAKVVALETIVVLDLVGLMGAYCAGTTYTSGRGPRDQTTKYTLVLTALVLFVIYVEYAMQLVPKLCRLAAGATATAAKAVATTPRVHAAGEAAPTVPPDGQIDVARSAAAAAQRLSATPRRRGSRFAAGTTEPSSMLSP